MAKGTEWKVGYPALDGLGASHKASTKLISLLRYNSNSQRSCECGHTMDCERVYLCPQELIGRAKKLGILTRTENVENVISFGESLGAHAAEVSILDKCPACLFAELLRGVYMCSICGERLAEGGTVSLVKEEGALAYHARMDGRLPVGALRVHYAKGIYLLTCDGRGCLRHGKVSGLFFFHGDRISHEMKKAA